MSDYLSRVVTRTDGGVRVSTSVLSADESRDVFGVPLADKGIQPVWIEVANGDDTAYWLMSPGVDPNFFPASEAADAFAAMQDGEARKELDQHFFGRSPDFVARKTGQGGGAANWVRVWVAPLRYRGQEVLVGQVGRPVGGRFAASEGIAPRLHPKVDEARDLLIQDLLYSEGLGSLAFATGVGQVSPEQPRGSTGAVHYYTDGLRAVLFFVTRPLDLSDVEILDWVPYLRRREADAADNK